MAKGLELVTLPLALAAGMGKMKKIGLVTGALLALSLSIGPPDAIAQLLFGLDGVEVFPGITTKDCAAQTYTTRGIKFAGVAHPNGTWAAKLNVEGDLDEFCQPVVCASPLEITGGVLVLNAFRSILVTDITGTLAFRPGPLLSGICPIAPLTAVLGDPALKTGIFRAVTGGDAEGDLDHNFIPARINADLTLTE
jgi:hypothetical protein